MIYMIYDFWNVLYFSGYFSTTCFQIGNYGEGITSFLLFRCFSDFLKSRGMSPFPKILHWFHSPSFFEFNNFVLRWYCAIAEANKNQPLITINMVKKFFFYLRHVGADTKVTSMWQPYTDMSIPHWYQDEFMHPQGE